jgi:hypothetical protein
MNKTISSLKAGIFFIFYSSCQTGRVSRPEIKEVKFVIYGKYGGVIPESILAS